MAKKHAVGRTEEELIAECPDIYTFNILWAANGVCR